MELLTVRHRDFTLRVSCDNFDKILSKAEGNKVECTSVYDWDKEGVESVTLNGKVINRKEEAEACFFDNADYPLWVEFNTEVKGACFNSDNRKVVESFPFHNGRQLLMGILKFGNEIGHSAIEFSYTLATGERRNFYFKFTVLSTKLDYYKHWKAIIRDIEQEYRTLSIDFLKKTFHSFEISDTSGDTPDLIWWQVFRGKHDEFTEAVRAILDRPRHRLRNQEIYQRADRIRRFTPQLENQLAEHRNESGHLYRTETPAINNDTYENRFLKHAVQYIAEKHATLGKNIVSDPLISENMRSEIQEKMEGMERIAQHPFFRSVGGFRGVTHESLVLQQATNYSTVYSIWLLLQQSYSLLDGRHNLETKDIATLYEIWCFIQMKEIVRREMGDGTEVDNACRMELNGQFVSRLDKGDHSRILFRKGDVELAELVYNPTQGKDDKRPINIDNLVSPTVPQKPDIVLRLTKWDRNKGMKLTYLFDAKYRIDGHKGDVDVPPEDAINQMHRYRDAIYYSENPQTDPNHRGLKKEVVGGYILFPGNGNKESVEMADFYRSIEKVNIGAFPLRPKDKENRALLEEFVQGLVKKEAGAQELLTRSNVIPQKGLRYEWEGAAAAESMIVQYVSKKDLDKYRRLGVFWVRLGTGHGSLRIDPRMASIRWIVFKPMGKSTEAYRYAVSDLGAEVLNREDMIKRGYKNNNFHDPYLVYSLDGEGESIDWEEFQKSTSLNGLTTNHSWGKHPYIYPPLATPEDESDGADQSDESDQSDQSDGSDHRGPV